MTGPLPPLPTRAFCLIRHGETTANRAGLIAGRLDVALTEAGREQARALADRVWPKPLALFTSPMARARETAALGFSHCPATVRNGLRERDWGIFEGRPLAELPRREDTPDNGEGWAEMILRVHTALTDCIRQAGPALPVIVCHSGVIRATRLLTGQPDVGQRAPNARAIHYRPLPGGTPLTHKEEIDEL